MTRDNLDQIDPETVKEMYLQSRQSELADSTLRAHSGRLALFVRWCNDNDITTIDELTA